MEAERIEEQRVAAYLKACRHLEHPLPQFLILELINRLRSLIVVVLCKHVLTSLY